MSNSSRPSGATLIDWLVTIATAAIVAIFVAERVLTTGLLGDELLFYHAIDLGIPESLLAPGSSHPPLFRLIVDLFTKPDSPDWLFRLPSCLLSIGAVFVWQRILLRLIEDRLLRCLILPAMALNPVWLLHSYQCLPYAPLTFAVSLHCLAWMRMIERPGFKTNTLFVLTASVLPWIHFYGINVLLADLFVWFMLWLKSRHLKSEARQGNPASGEILRCAIWTNIAIAALTLPVVPIVLFYLLNDRSYPLHQIADYWRYFFSASSHFFSTVTFPELPFALPVLAIVYCGVALFLWKFCVSRTSQRQEDDLKNQLNLSYGIVSISLFLGGFTATQLHSLMGQTAMWPRYMLAGAWMHLPLILYLLASFRFKKLAYMFAFYCVFLSLRALLAIPLPAPPGSDYQKVANYIDQSCRPDDAFLVQSMDLWVDENHFDRIWYERYTNSQLPMVSGLHAQRHQLQTSGLQLKQVDPQIKRIWVYSHLFKEPWLRSQSIEDWELVSIQNFGGPFPLALFERTESDAPAQLEVALQRSHGFSGEVEERERSRD